MNTLKYVFALTETTLRMLKKKINDLQYCQPYNGLDDDVFDVLPHSIGINVLIHMLHISP